MKTHEHAIISLGYAGIVSFLAEQGLGDPGIYIAALVGGEIMDFIDHPSYFLLYGRNESHVIEARKKLRSEGIKSAIDYLAEIENRREIVKLFLHNIYFVTIIAFFSIMVALFFVPIFIYSFFWADCFFICLQICIVTFVFSGKLITGYGYSPEKY